MASKKRKLIEGLIPKKKTSGKPKTKTDAMSEEAKVREKHPDATHAEILKIIKKEKAAKRATARKRESMADSQLGPVVTPKPGSMDANLDAAWTKRASRKPKQVTKKNGKPKSTKPVLTGPQVSKQLPELSYKGPIAGAGVVTGLTLLGLGTESPKSGVATKKQVRKPKGFVATKKQVREPKGFVAKTKTKTAVPMKQANAKIPSQRKGRKWAGKYKVSGGESLSKIAKKFGVSLKSLLNANPKFKKNPNLIKVGQNVAVPEAKIKGTGTSIYKGMSKSAMAKMAKAKRPVPPKKIKEPRALKQPKATSFTKKLPDREVGAHSLPPSASGKPLKLEPKYSTSSKRTLYKKPGDPKEAQRLLNKIEQMSQKQINDLGDIKYNKMLKTIRNLQTSSKGGKVMKKQVGGRMSRVGLSPAEMARAGVMSEAQRRRYVSKGGKVGKKKGGTVKRKHGGQIGTSFIASLYD